MSAAPALRCAGCGAVVAGDAAEIFRCPNAGAGDDRDHVLVPETPPASASFATPGSLQPFLRYRELLWTHRLARAGGLTEADWTDLVRTLDDAVAAVDGRGFVPTPFAPQPRLARALGLASGAVWVKDETGNVAGSHKARHLFGVALALEVRVRLGLEDAADRGTRELAIASCGNAALAAAVLAKAMRRPLRVFIPEDANPRVRARLDALGARIEVCRREAGASGDPCIIAFRAARARGAIPFCVQGDENGLTIEGGATLACEMAEAFAAAGVASTRLFVQTGGGAFASACLDGFALAQAHGVLASLPRLHVVQTAGAAPLRRAWQRVAARALAGDEAGTLALVDDACARALREPARAGAVRDAMRHAREHRGRYMWPWESAPHSIAHGILDDETYDWARVVEGTIASGGWPVTATEAQLGEARALAHATTGIGADATGAAGLAGLIALSRAGAIGVDECVALVFSGVER